MARIVFNDKLASQRDAPSPSRAPLEFHRRLPEYRSTRLARCPELANRLGIGELLVKDESNRLGLPAFKVLGASWATYCLVAQMLGRNLQGWANIQELRTSLDSLRPLELITATDGNHGRAVARVAAWLGFDARVFIPAGTCEARRTAIESEGATVIEVQGTYDEAVSQAADAAGDRRLLIQDTSWPGYEEIPRWVIEGYSTMLWEIDDQLESEGRPGPDLVFVQVGVGSLAAAVVSQYRRKSVKPKPRILTVEPTRAACALAAFEHDRPVTVPGPHDSVMVGLNCGTLATVAWSILRSGVDCFVAVDDNRAREAMRELAAAGLISGESGAAGLAGLLELLGSPEADSFRERLRVDSSTRVLIISTEGATDPASYAQIVGRPPSGIRDGEVELA